MKKLNWKELKHMYVDKGDPIDFSKPFECVLTLYVQAGPNYGSTSFDQFFIDIKGLYGWRGVHEISDDQKNDTQNFFTFPDSMSIQDKIWKAGEFLGSQALISELVPPEYL